LTPRGFDDVQQVADHLKARRPVVLNLEGSERDVAQRIINFLSGTIYALSGEMHRIGSHVLFFAPGGVEVSVEGRLPRREPLRDAPTGYERSGE
ncbi:MAG TPA: cell division protein SepF, partial [Bacillota bacterium]